MIKSLYISTLFVLLALLMACGGSKALTRKGEKLDEAGLYQESAKLHYEALLKNPRNIDAQIGLKKNGQKVLNDELENFFKSMSMNDRESAVNKFLEGQAYYDRVKAAGVTLNIPDHYFADFNKVKGEYIETLYAAGTEQLEAEQFEEAESTLSRIVELEPNYEDAKRLRDEAYMEPIYREAVQAKENAHYRSSYILLIQVRERDPYYKDIDELRQEVLRDGAFAVAILPFENTTKRNVASKVVAHTTSSMANLNDPFLKIVDRENIERILEEQRLGLSGMIDEATAVDVGQLMGAQAVLMGTVIDYREEKGRLKKSTKEGFESYQVRKIDDEGKQYFQTRYKSVRYDEYFQENKVYLSVSYKLVSLKTGEVLATNIVEDSRQDDIYYANYSGDKNKLYPARDGKVYTNGRNNLRSLMNASRKLKTVGILAADAYKNTGNKIAINIELYLKDSDL